MGKARGENELVKWFAKHGVPALRTAPIQSGAGRRSDVADVAFGANHKYTAECKRHATGYATVYKELASADLLWIRTDGNPPIFVLSESMAAVVLPLLMEVEQ